MTELAMRSLRENILKGSLLPGTRLIPSKLESQLGLGRVAIREAIRELIGLGLVNQVSNSGAYVAKPPSIDELKEIFGMRILIEGEMVLRATNNISPKVIEILEELCHKMDVTKILAKDLFFLNREFHSVLYKLSGWEILYKFSSQLFDQVLIFRSTMNNDMYFEGFYKEFNRDHWAILKALKNRDGEEVKRNLVNNLNRGLDQILANLSYVNIN